MTPTMANENLSETLTPVSEATTPADGKEKQGLAQTPTANTTAKPTEPAERFQGETTHSSPYLDLCSNEYTYYEQFSSKESSSFGGTAEWSP